MGISTEASLVQVTKKRVVVKKSSNRRVRRILMKRRSGSSYYGIQRRVRTLKRLVPNYSNSIDDSVGLEGLFRETANYILSLQTRVNVMQVMVEMLNAAGSDARSSD